MRINGFDGISLIDYPGKVASIVYTSPCNFKCPFCHNPSLVTVNDETISVDYVISEISERAGFIEGVTITGGEPLMQDDIGLFIDILKKTGLKVKLDTNGYMPERLKELLDSDSLDFVAMDIKSSHEKYRLACGVKVDLDKIRGSIAMIMESGIDYEFRTTVVPGIVDDSDIPKIGGMINGAKSFTIQQFRNDKTFDGLYKKITPYPEEKLEAFADVMKQFAVKVKVLNTAVTA